MDRHHPTLMQSDLLYCVSEPARDFDPRTRRFLKLSPSEGSVILPKVSFGLIVFCIDDDAVLELMSAAF